MKFCVSLVKGSCKIFPYGLPFSHNISVTDRQTGRRHIVP